MKTSERLFKTSIIYFIGQVFTKLISFVLLPLYTNYINVSDFGDYDLVISVLGVAVPVVFLEMWTAALRFAIEKENDSDKRKVVNNSLIAASLSMALYFVLYFVLCLFLDFQNKWYVLLYSVLWVFQLMYLSVSRAYGKNALYAVSGVVGVLVNTLVSVAAVILMNGNAAALYIGMCASFFVQALIIDLKIGILRGFRLSDYDKELFCSIVKFSLPLSLNSVIYWLMEGCNKLIIKGVLGSVANGLYAVGNRLSTVLNLFVQVFILSWQESAFRITDRDEKDKVYTQCINSFIKVVGACLVLLLPVVKFAFPILIGAAYSEVYGLVPWLLASIYMSSLCSVISPLFAAEKQTKYSLYSKIIMAAVNLAVIFSLIGKLGLYASPVALIAANLVGFIVQLRFAVKFVKIKLQIKNILLFLLFFAASAGAYIFGGNAVNGIWFAVALIFYVFYLRDFIKEIFSLIKNQFKKRG